MLAAHDSGIELLDEPLGSFVVSFGIRRGPPVAQIAPGVILPALIIEQMRDFMGHGRAERSIVQSVICLRVEEWRLKFARRIMKNVAARVRAAGYVLRKQ